MSTTATVQPELEHWIIEQARTGTPPEAVLQRLLGDGGAAHRVEWLKAPQ